jgi:pilus assembly protein CpaF
MSQRIIDMVQGSARPSDAHDALRRELHEEIVSRFELHDLVRLPVEEMRVQLRAVLVDMVREKPIVLPREERSRLVEATIDEVLGFGPVERLLQLPDVTDVLINGPDQVYVERFGRLERVDIRFRDEEHLVHVIRRIAASVGRRVDASSPLVDARLPNGTRVNAVLPPVALDGPSLSLRRFNREPMTAERLVKLGSAPQFVVDLLAAAVRGRLNLLVVGGAGSGKTTILNLLSGFVPEGERIVTIEDAAELRLQQRHVVRLETRPPNLEGHGEITARGLLKNALRMRPDRIIVGEIRGSEAIDMLQAMNTGHEGSLSTLHANTPRHAMGRLQTMVGMGLDNISISAIREMIADAVHLIVQTARLSDGKRRIMSITEITGMEAGVVATQEIFRFRQRTVDAGGRVRGTFEATGVRPVLAKRLEAHGVRVPAEWLSLSVDV